MLTCPLCHSTDAHSYAQDKWRSYYQCAQCRLVFVPPEYLPSQAQELAEYQLHDNDIHDPGYRQFLSRLAEPLLDKLNLSENGPLKGLDYGCGPGPALADMLTKAGCDMAIYDPLFFNNKHVFSNTYDFITCTEAIEHFHRPAHEWSTLMAGLKPGGWLGVMTKRVVNQSKFASWHYKNDQTHVCFFSEDTFDYLAKKWSLYVEYPSADVALFKRLC